MGIYFSLSSLLLPFHPSIQPSQSYEPLLRSTLTCLGLSIPILVIWSRIKLGLHTRLQCLAGFTLGLALAFTLFLVWNGYESLNFRAGGGLESLKGTGLIESGIGIKVEEVLDPWLKSFVGQVRRKLELWEGRKSIIKCIICAWSILSDLQEGLEKSWYLNAHLLHLVASLSGSAIQKEYRKRNTDEKAVPRRRSSTLIDLSFGGDSDEFRERILILVWLFRLHERGGKIVAWNVQKGDRAIGQVLSARAFLSLFPSPSCNNDEHGCRSCRQWEPVESGIGNEGVRENQNSKKSNGFGRG